MPRIQASETGVTQLLLAWREGDEAALARLTPLVHAELQRIARRCMRGQPPDHSLQATALVNEAYVRLVDVQQMNRQNRAHFLAMAARLMRRVLVDSARARGYQKRGGGAVRVSFSEELAVTDRKGLDVVGLDDALHALADLDERQSRVIELRFFGGLSVAETAAVLGISSETVMRDWKMARAWLMREMNTRTTT
ncbi:MAG TPA: sigma-70 family RNA polymerase sigma factor [Vicinamibacterales bacterium]|jgi:RNA polymerase sigma factor (TIGR02999 family)|nr:sigma-70 family RNA polymerase sigma factor [Vicinamibacterales bacterium]